MKTTNKKSLLKWSNISNSLMVAKWNPILPIEPKAFKMRGHYVFSGTLSFNPLSGQRYKQLEWFLFAEKK